MEKYTFDVSVAKSYYRTLGASYVSVLALEYLQLVFDAWYASFEPFRLMPSTLFPWTSEGMLDLTKEEYTIYHELLTTLSLSCKKYNYAEYRERRDQDFIGTEGDTYMVPRVSFSEYYWRCTRGLNPKRKVTYCDYLGFLDAEMDAKSLSLLCRVAPKEFFEPLTSIPLFHVLEAFEVVPKQLKGKRPTYPLITLRNLLKQLYEVSSFIEACVPFGFSSRVIAYDV